MHTSFQADSASHLGARVHLGKARFGIPLAIQCSSCGRERPTARRSRAVSYISSLFRAGGLSRGPRDGCLLEKTSEFLPGPPKYIK